MAEKLLKPNQVLSLRKAPGRYADGGGLYLEVRSERAASWIVRMQVDGKRRDFGLGSAEKVSLASAREKRDALRGQFAAGIDPVAERKRAIGIPTFQQAAEQVHRERLKIWSNGKHQDQWIQTLRTYAFPTLGAVPINAVERGHILGVLTPIWVEKPETARRVKQRIGVVLDWAFGKGWRDAEAPMRALSRSLPKVDSSGGHFAAMPYSEVPAFMQKLRERDGMGALALEATILTAARSGEIRGATWSEVDFDAALWSIPAERMKRKRPHVVPLSPSAVAVFRRALELRNRDSELCFPGVKRGRPLSDATLRTVLRRMGLDHDPHGFRSAFKDWAGEIAGYANELSELALAHVAQDKTERAYRRGEMLARRRGMMDAWAEYCCSIKS